METEERLGQQTRLQAEKQNTPLENTPSTSSTGQETGDEIFAEESENHSENNAGDNDLETIPNSNHELGTKTAVILLLFIFSSSAIAMFLVWKTFPAMDPEDEKSFKFPKDIEDAKQLGNVLSRYKEQYYAQVLGGFLCVYVFLQTFAIPGSIFLSIISGFLFPFPVALFSVCFCSATGASFCYLLSYLVGRKLVRHYLPERAAQWSAKVDNHRSNLLSYILFLRITPFLPNWFINIVSPVIGVPLFPFWVGSFFGVAPPSFIFIQAGTTLQQLTSTMDPITVETVLLLVVFALLSILPVLMKNKLKTKFE
eukprot:GFUD01030241.1.p1 GENE.GFUD01030241.1~~GFUD01030241.1.p1  ORF type:complete len:311 (+),score=67.40 GFUD01030241.1:41-973(+)